MGHRLSKIYTRTGDAGTTGLGDGSRTEKDAARVEAYGTVDELSSVIGMLLAHETGGSGVCKDFQHPLPRPLRPRDDLRTAVSRMFSLDTDWLPCVDENGRLTGVVTRQSVTQTLHQRARSREHVAAEHG